MKPDTHEKGSASYRKENIFYTNNAKIFPLFLTNSTLKDTHTEKYSNHLL